MAPVELAEAAVGYRLAQAIEGEGEVAVEIGGARVGAAGRRAAGSSAPSTSPATVRSEGSPTCTPGSERRPPCARQTEPTTSASRHSASGRRSGAQGVGSGRRPRRPQAPNTLTRLCRRHAASLPKAVRRRRGRCGRPMDRAWQTPRQVHRRTHRYSQRRGRPASTVGPGAVEGREQRTGRARCCSHEGRPDHHRRDRRHDRLDARGRRRHGHDRPSGRPSLRRLLVRHPPLRRRERPPHLPRLLGPASSTAATGPGSANRTTRSASRRPANRSTPTCAPASCPPCARARSSKSTATTPTCRRPKPARWTAGARSPRSTHRSSSTAGSSACSASSRRGPAGASRADEKELFSQVAVLAAIAIRNADLFDRLDQQNRSLQSLLEASRALTSTVGLDETLTVMARSAAEALNVPGLRHLRVPGRPTTPSSRARRSARSTIEPENVPIPLLERSGDRLALERREIVVERVTDESVPAAVRQRHAGRRRAHPPARPPRLRRPAARHAAPRRDVERTRVQLV